MADLFARDTKIALLIMACAVLVVLPLQLVLCCRAKKLFVKCLPAIALALAAIVFYVLAVTSGTWAAFMYLIIAAFFGTSFVFSGIAWSIWAILKLISKRNRVA